MAACALFLVGALGFILPVLLGADGDQQGSEFPAPQLALHLKPGSGPIAARMVYLIAEESLEMVTSGHAGSP
ncbi:MFS transporter [Rhizobium laguerreae]|uniref:MFS transporter n=1 Tax=Rhizobium laguerreae TaxID=1076926 RepID=UPI001FED4B56|nr:MFS transporter [Rhizobium laguerreae]